MTGGLFVTLDGPGGVGKSTLTGALAAVLRESGLVVHETREPTDAPLGNLARHGTDTYRGRTMAHLIAADRYQHLETEIRPALARGEIVVCDRYIASSLVLQVMDGLDRDLVWQLNESADLPDLAVFVTGHPDVIADRLTARGAHSRYERQPGSTRVEYGLFADAATFLTDRGVNVLELDATATDPETLARIVAGEVLALRSRKPHDAGSADVQPQQPVQGAGGAAALVSGVPAGTRLGADGDGTE
ncbi:dTMP kinase [Streptomyces luteolifulvus]|uniref:dTMP kinase n=1 Tax=Streptomyces luteolifulvus TaxID=2615112 RepID=UPI001CD96E64|nr:dTMP kinase [Streptomyces luteolifulvus]